eukprot:5590400-Pleurochrysis_carterae.AAC.1
MSVDERTLAAVPIGQALPEPEVVPARPESPDTKVAAQWAELKQKAAPLHSPSLDELVSLIGLTAVKEQALRLFEKVRRERALPAERRIAQTVHFALLGNPGTGKTTVAKLLAKMLHEVGVRRSDVFVATTGEKLARMGADK